MTCFQLQHQERIEYESVKHIFFLTGLSVGENYTISGHFPMEDLLILVLSLIGAWKNQPMESADVFHYTTSMPKSMTF